MKIRRVLGGFAWALLAGALLWFNAAAVTAEEMTPLQQTVSVSKEVR